MGNIHLLNVDRLAAEPRNEEWMNGQPKKAGKRTWRQNPITHKKHAL
jgi:hypothetical protein